VSSPQGGQWAGIGGSVTPEYAIRRRLGQIFSGRNQEILLKIVIFLCFMRRFSGKIFTSTSKTDYDDSYGGK
jgi:hypothetical protein